MCAGSACTHVSVNWVPHRHQSMVPKCLTLPASLHLSALLLCLHRLQTFKRHWRSVRTPCWWTKTPRQPTVSCCLRVHVCGPCCCKCLSHACTVASACLCIRKPRDTQTRIEPSPLLPSCSCSHDSRCAHAGAQHERLRDAQPHLALCCVAALQLHHTQAAVRLARLRFAIHCSHTPHRRSWFRGRASPSPLSL